MTRFIQSDRTDRLRTGRTGIGALVPRIFIHHVSSDTRPLFYRMALNAYTPRASNLTIVSTYMMQTRDKK